MVPVPWATLSSATEIATCATTSPLPKIRRDRGGPARPCRSAFAGAVTKAATAGASPEAPSGACPSFRVLHNDRIGAAVLPAGSYSVTVEGGLGCRAASQAFARFLEDYDGILPGGWRVTAEGSGKATFRRSSVGFSVAREGGGEEGGNSLLGVLCKKTYVVNAGSQVGPLFFPRGGYLLYVPAGSQISCRRASSLFTRFIAAPGGTLPFPWRVLTQTATFYKPAHAQRSSFRVEPVGGAGPR